MRDGLFRFQLDPAQIPSKLLPGKYGFVIQLNIKRSTERRPSEINLSPTTNIPFDRNRFNFTRIDKNEFLFKFVKTDDTNDPSLNNQNLVTVIKAYEIGRILLNFT
jgi:hypothetical protein